MRLILDKCVEQCEKWHKENLVVSDCVNDEIDHDLSNFK